MNSNYNNNFLYFQEEGHKYTDTLGNEYLSVTTNIENYCPKFNADYFLFSPDLSKKQRIKNLFEY